MSNNNRSWIAGTLKTVFITILKLAAIVIAFAFKVAGLIITKIGEVFEKLYNNGTH